MEKSSWEYLIYFNLVCFTIVYFCFTGPGTRKCPERLWLPEMHLSPRTNRSAMRTRDGVTFWAASSFWDSASFCQCPVSSASLSPFLSLSWILSMSLWAPRNSADAANLKKSNFKRMRSQASPTLVPCSCWLFAEVLHKGEESPSCAVPCTHHRVVHQGFPVQLPPPSVHTTFLLRRGREMHAVFHLNSKTVRLFIPAQEPVQVVIQRSVMGWNREKQWEHQVVHRSLTSFHETLSREWPLSRRAPFPSVLYRLDPAQFDPIPTQTSL